MRRFLDRFKRMFIMAFWQLQDPYYHGFAAQISFYLILSIVPIFLLLVQILGVLGVSADTAIGLIEDYTGNNIPGFITSILTFNSIGFGSIIYIAIALWAGSRASFAISRITNYTLSEGETTGMNYFAERLRAILTMALTILTLVISIVILVYGKLILMGALSLLNIDAEGYVDSLWLLLRWPLGFMLYFLMVGWTYYIGPTRRRSFKHFLPGTIFASFGMLIVTAAYSYYTTSLVHYDLMYGALSSVVAILMWFLLLSWVLILGVLCNKVWEDTSHPFSKRTPPEELMSRVHHKHHQSKFDLDPDDIGIGTIKDILIHGSSPEDMETTKKEDDTDNE